MGLQKHQVVILPLTMMIWISYYSNSCYSSYNIQEDPLTNSLDDDLPSVYDHQSTSAYPTYFGTIDDLNTEFDPDFDPYFSSWFNYEPEISSFVSLDQVGSPSSSIKVVNVVHYGAKGDGRTDDTKVPISRFDEIRIQAFDKAWKEACSSTGGAVLLVPQNKKYFLKPIEFSGPCKSDLTMKVHGTIEASADRSDYKQDTRHWIIFNNVQNFIIEGGGTIHGNGNIWWKNSCKINKSLPCTIAPTALTFYKCSNLRVKNLRIKDSQQIHISIEQSVNVQALNLMITAPETSPNTDGIHITATRNIQIVSSIIKTGDDCISIENGSQNVHAMDITCGPGHGISIGSLGDGKSEAHVSNVVIDSAKLIGTTNGVRIKTWQGGSGNANKIIFQNISMKNVSNPIIIDQNYCDQSDPCTEQDYAVQVQDVVYKNIKGTSASNVAINFDCSKKYPCRGIVLQDINLVLEGGDKAEASCKNAKLNKKGKVSPYCP